MLIQKKVSSKKNAVMGIVAVVLLLITVVVLYFTVIREPNIDVGDLSVASSGVVPSQKINTTFETDILNDVRFDNLKQFGPVEVEVQQRGRKADPFKPF